MKYEEITDRLERQRTMKNARFYPKPSKGLVNMSKVKIQAMIVSDYKTLTALPEVFTKQGYIFDFLAEKYAISAHTIYSMCYSRV